MTLHNAEFLQKDDGLWLSMKTSKGQYALINWTRFCYERGPVIGDASMQWAEDQLQALRGECPQCAELERTLEQQSALWAHCERQREAWEKAWDALYAHFSRKKVRLKMRQLDPRRKAPEPKWRDDGEWRL